MMRILALLYAAMLLVACSGSESDNPNDASAEEPPFFTADKNATGPLTLAELQIDIPKDVEKWMTESKKSCFMDAVERRAREAGDPAAINPDDFPYWGGNVDREKWSQHSNHIQRVLLAQAIVSWAMMDC
ncbi:MAG: hypothetical protein EX272_05065 [Chromatiales bacterium]|nr:MAG: hypothetical protein EX272_05065 [Chromatiales bacterium]